MSQPSIRQRLQQTRAQRGLTADQVVVRARHARPNVRGLHQTALLAWESMTAGRSPSAEQLEAWAAALEFDLTLTPIAPA